MEPSVIANKLKQLLEKLLESKCHPTKIDSYLEKLLERQTAENTFPIFSEWLTRAISFWCANKTTPPTTIAVFTLNLASALSKNEERYSNLNSNNFFIKLVNVLKARQVEVAPSVKLAYIRLLSSFLEHKSGIEWMIVCNFWEDVYQMGLTDQTTEVKGESLKFIAKILEKTVDHDVVFCDNVVKRMMLPLGENSCRSVGSNETNGRSVEICQNLKSTLQLIGSLLEHFLEEILFARKDFRIALIFFKNFQSEERISDFMVIAQNKDLLFEVMRITYIMQFLELYVNTSNTSVNVKTSIRGIMTSFLSYLYKANFEDFKKLCSFGQLYWNLMETKIRLCSKHEIISFANQLTVFQLVPNFCLILKNCFAYLHLEEELLIDDFRDVFMEKIYDMFSHDAIRVCYVWRDSLMVQPNLFKIAEETLLDAKEERKYYSREKAAIIFQILIYVLRDFVVAMKECPEKQDLFMGQVPYLSLNLELLTTFIEEFSITWKDSLEAVDVTVITFEFLSLPGWPTELVVKALKLINTSIAKYMSVNLALLVDRTTDSTVALLGPLLYLKLHDDVSEVKEAASEVICTMSRISNSKFPSLQKVLMDSELPTLIVKMSTCDGESFVRATAIKCLQEMIQVEEIWNNALKTENLPEKMREILLNETEGIVRVEAASFMCIAYEQQQFPKEALDRIYETMIHSSTTDLHWEVKVRALGFWDRVIKNHLQNQGMIDGSFPNVTFSKEHRKIVTLTDSEIRKRLQKVLNQLSAIGCLGVLVSAIKDDCDVEVSKTAVKITQGLVELFKKYNLYGDYSAPVSPMINGNGVSSSASSGISLDEVMDSPASYHPDFNDEIIDQIVNSKDVALLKNVYSPSDYGSVSNFDIQVRKIVAPAEFLQYTQQDLNSIITEKKNWLNGIEDLGSLLDDMLKTYEDDVNNMDCY